MYYARMKVPVRLQAAVARVLDQGKDRQTFLKKSLGTKDLKAANVRAKPVQAGFDRVLSEAEQLLSARPMRDTLSAVEIKRIAEMHFAATLEADETARREGTGSEPAFQSIAAQLAAAGVMFKTPFNIGALPEAGLSDREVHKRSEQLEYALHAATSALARGHTAIVQEPVAELLDAYQINLDPSCEAYRRLAMAVLSADVKALQAIARRDLGEPVDTPAIPEILGQVVTVAGGSLHDAFEGWKKERERGVGTLYEYGRAIDLFTQLHGNLALVSIKKSHAREFREALQLVPRMRKGKLLKAPLPELCAWGKRHPEAQKVASGTVNKQLGAVQAIASWGNHNGVVPDDTPWADPFQKMRVEEERSERTSFVSSELQRIFDAPLFTAHEWPGGAGGAAGVWLPLLSLFNGARQAELAGLKVSNVQEDPETGAPLLFVVAQRRAGKSLKTKGSERVVPVHPQLVTLGFLKYVAARKRTDGAEAWLFPLIAPEHGRARIASWSKWFGRYLRGTVGVLDTAKVFHSFRHGFKDALRKASSDEELRDALTGHRGARSVGREYGAKEMLLRWGIKPLKNAVGKVAYQGLDLSRVKPFEVVARKRA
jgi:integrase